MPARPTFLALAIVVAALVAGGAVGAPASVIASVTDGDTLRVTSGQRIRLLQIDAPEANECYAKEARTALLRLTPTGSSVALEADARLDQVDRYGRLLRYVKRGGVHVNVELVRLGAAEPYFYRGERGRYATRLLEAARAAKSAGRGLWGASCGAQSDPVPLVPPTGSCDPNYAGACVPPSPPDLDCPQLRALGLALPVRVVGSDPHRLDADGDGLGCE
jgi:endonuclease YncB( thermonuclease family)